jgi:hypothetical protein
MEMDEEEDKWPNLVLIWHAWMHHRASKNSEVVWISFANLRQTMHINNVTYE